DGFRLASSSRRTLLYNDTSYKGTMLPEPESTDLAPASQHLAVSGASSLQQPAATAESRSPREWLLFVIWRQKWLVLAVLLISAFAGVIYQKVATPIYAGTARLYVQPTGLTLGSGAGTNYGQAGVAGNFLYTQRERVTSEPVLAIAAGKLRALEKEKKERKDPNWEIQTLKGLDKPAAYLKEIVSA